MNPFIGAHWKTADSHSDSGGNSVYREGKRRGAEREDPMASQSERYSCGDSRPRLSVERSSMVFPPRCKSV